MSTRRLVSGKNRDALMRFLIAALAIALTITTAQAQVTPQASQMQGAQRLGNSAERNGQYSDTTPKAKVDDKAYNAVLKNLPDKQYDPWHGAR